MMCNLIDFNRILTKGFTVFAQMALVVHPVWKVYYIQGGSLSDDVYSSILKFLNQNNYYLILDTSTSSLLNMLYINV